MKQQNKKTILINGQQSFWNSSLVNEQPYRKNNPLLRMILFQANKHQQHHHHQQNTMKFASFTEPFFKKYSK